MNYKISHYESSENPIKKDVIDFLWEYNDEFDEDDEYFRERVEEYVLGCSNSLYEPRRT